MIKINSTKQPIKRLIVLLITTMILALLILLLNISVKAEVNRSSGSGYDAGKAYYNSDYNYLNDENSVFQSITWEQAVYLFEQPGNYLVLFGGSWCPNTTAVIDYINNAAKAAGVDTIYNLDFRLDGTSGDSHIRETNGSAKKGAAYNYLYGELVTRYLTNLNDWVEYTIDSESALTYTNSEGAEVTVPKVQVPFLFLYNKDNTVNHAGDSVNGTKYPIVYGFEKMLYRDGNGEKALYTSSSEQNDTTRVDDYTEQLNDGIFSHVNEYKLSSFTDADYIRLAYNEKSGKTLFDEGDQINIRTVTYRQLDWLLRQDGNYLILFGGTWCGNTQAVIDIINDYAVANNVIVYNFDTKLDGGYAKKYWGYPEELHIRDNNNVFANLYVDLVNKYLDNIETEYTIESGNYIFYQTAPDDESTKKIANKLQVPYLFAYNKDAIDDNGHDIPILGYVEKMFVLDETREDFIGNEANHTEYSNAVSGVIDAYKNKFGDTSGGIIKSEISEISTDESITDVNEENNGGSNNTAKIIVAVIGVIAVIGVVVFLAIGKNRSSGGGGCC